MIIKDPIYGTFDVNEPVLAELISSGPVQRLKRIAQYGVPNRYYVFKNFSRYEHSVGVMLLVRRLGASIEEQAAGLLHDVSHTAFSHVVDWLLGSGEKEDHQDKIHSEIFMNSELPVILEKHDLGVRKVSDYKNFPLVEQPTPRLCADRIDYALREFRLWAAPSIVGECFSSLTTKDGRMVFSSKITAKKFAEAFLNCQMVHWGGPQATIRYTLLAAALRIATENKIISENDLLNDDEFVLEKLENCANAGVKRYLRMLADKNLLVVEDPHNPQYIMKKKFRYVDPEYTENGEVFTLTDTDNGFKALLEENRRINSQGLKLSIK
ncbi:MAG: HD domain-containing protein [Candidatus Aenigmarchaeota archaeon]|nr:HD domain-containing protein [Candidatus Aenigmarchaeota archaeon]